ncbi:hypothetical protein ACQJBY_019666 [Aegilops geniculata]
MAMNDSNYATVLDDLPEAIIIDEVLLRLPAKDVLRCRMVRKSWCHATSTKDFLVAHHKRQPSLPVIKQIKYINNHYIFALCDSSTIAARSKLCCLPIFRYPIPHLDNGRFFIYAICDGLIIVPICEEMGLFDVCNPTTHQHAPLRLLRGHMLPNRSVQISALYQHHPSGEYRMLYSIWTRNEVRQNCTIDFYVLTVGSNKPRTIGQPPVEYKLLNLLTCSSNAPVLHRGNLHWKLGTYSYYDAGNIMVFDTTSEAFRWMLGPTHTYLSKSLLEMDSALGMCCSQNFIVTDIYVIQDYEAEVWDFMYRINISELEDSPPINYRIRCVEKIAMLNERELLIELLGGSVLHCDIDGKFLGIIECDEGEKNSMHITTFRFRENIIPLPFFEMQDGFGKNM